MKGMLTLKHPLNMLFYYQYVSQPDYKNPACGMNDELTLEYCKCTVFHREHFKCIGCEAVVIGR
jgi:hypothetical protein